MSITFNTQYLKGYITEEELAPVMQKAKKRQPSWPAARAGMQP